MELHRITSRENRRIVNARKVRDGKERGHLFIEGRRLVTEALRSDINIYECFVAEDFRDTEIINSLAGRGLRISELSETVFRSVSATEHSQGIVLLADRPSRPVLNFSFAEAVVPIFLFLEQINNPSNLGAIARSVEAAGAGGIFISKRSADVFSPKALRASMGAAFRIRVTENAELLGVLDRASSAGISCLAVDRAAANSYLQIDWKQPHLLVFGSEAHGLSNRELGLVRNGVSIPMENSVESLNLAVAAGIVLFEAKRQVQQLGY